MGVYQAPLTMAAQVSGACVNTLSSHLGEVTSVELNRQGQYLLSSSKDPCMPFRPYAMPASTRFLT